MVFNDKVEIYKKERLPDGFGGHKEEDIFIEQIECKITTMTVNKQNLYFGNMSTTALSLITNYRVDTTNFIKINDTMYEIIRVSKAFNKYIVDVEVLGV